MKKGLAVLLLVVSLVAVVHETAAVTCSPMELFPCLGSLTGGQDPSEDCCVRLKEQQPCFCQYMQNPAYKPYIDSQNARKIASICAVAIPTC